MWDTLLNVQTMFSKYQVLHRASNQTEQVPVGFTGAQQVQQDGYAQTEQNTTLHHAKRLE